MSNVSRITAHLSKTRYKNKKENTILEFLKVIK